MPNNDKHCTVVIETVTVKYEYCNQ